MVKALFSLVAVLAAFLLTCHACLDEEARSLLLFKKMQESHNSSFNHFFRTWKEGSDCCKNWERVGCNPLTHHIQSLDFSGDILDEYSDEYSVDEYSVVIKDCETLLPLSNLQGLTSLNMAASDFNVSLVLACLGRFPSLREINLANNYYGSSISSAFQEWPSEALQRLSSLDLRSSSSSGSLPPQLQNMTSLVSLDLSENYFTSDFHELRGLSNLKRLFLSDLNPDKVAWSAWNFSRLMELNLQACYLRQHHIEQMKWLKLNKGMESLTLTNNMLTDISFIGHFPHLRELYAGENSIKGRIPESIGNLTSLHSLSLGSNELHGRIPMSIIGNLGSLDGLDLSNNSLSGSIPMSIGNLSSLEELYLSGNSLSGSIPMSIGNLSSLEELDLSDNSLSGSIPCSLSNLSRLAVLDISNNQLSGSIPCSLSNLSRLAYLDIGYNQLNGSISCLALPSSLTHVDFGENQMEGTISEAFLSNLVNLDYLVMTRSGLSMNVSNTWIPGFSCRLIELGSCKINSSFPEWISTQPNLDYLDLSNTSLYGEIPTWLWELPPQGVLAGLNLSRNELEGHVNDLGRFGSVDLSFNNFKGSMPALFTPSTKRFFNLSDVFIYLNVRNNGFEGPLTSDLAVTALQFLDASNNNLTGPIPSVYSNCSKIEFLNLANNNLNGSLPKGFGGNFQSLEYLSLFNNKLEGTLPESLSASNELQVLNVGNNVFGGQFPKWITQLKQLRILEMRSNRLEGNIPEELGTMQYLHIIDISSNHISGQIPKSISALPRLLREVQDSSSENNSADILSYSYGSGFSGSTVTTFEEIEFFVKGLFLPYPHIPMELSCIYLSNNLLTGEIPIDLGNLKGLMLLNLSRNHLTGPIPISIGNMSALEELDLSDNKLSGGIPIGFTRLDSMGFLNLSYNNLSGKIPRTGHMLTFDHQFFEGNPNLTDPLLLLVDKKKRIEAQTAEETEESGGHDQEFWWAITVGVSFGVGFATFVSAWVFESRFRKYVNSSMDPIILWLLRYRD